MTLENSQKARGVAVLGATGSIGTSALDVIRKNPDRFVVTSLAANRSWEALLPLLDEFHPSIVALSDIDAAAKLIDNLPLTAKVRVVSGSEAMSEAAVAEGTDIALCACSGAAGLESTVTAIKAGIDIALANKEVLVAGGEYVTCLVSKHDVKLLPVDSEHSAVFQSIAGDVESVERVILTASGGPFYGWSADALRDVTPAQALKHPNWSMGSKITIDSATMMNKGLEVIEAHWLFNTPFDKIDVVIHQQSIIHSLVEMKDRSVIAQLGYPDMKLPIQYALGWPKRLPTHLVEPLNLAKIGTLTFGEVDNENFPALSMAYEAGKAGKSVPTVLNSANEVAVAAFLRDEISFTGISELIMRVVDQHEPFVVDSVEAVLEADAWGRQRAASVLKTL